MEFNAILHYIQSMIIRTNLINLTNCFVVRHGCIFAIHWTFKMNKSDDMAQRSEPMRNGNFSIFMFFFYVLCFENQIFKFFQFFCIVIDQLTGYQIFQKPFPYVELIWTTTTTTITTRKMPFTFHSLCAALFIVNILNFSQCCARCASLSTQFEIITELICIKNRFGFWDSNTSVDWTEH